MTLAQDLSTKEATQVLEPYQGQLTTSTVHMHTIHQALGALQDMNASTAAASPTATKAGIKTIDYRL